MEDRKQFVVGILMCCRWKFALCSLCCLMMAFWR